MIWQRGARYHCHVEGSLEFLPSLPFLNDFFNEFLKIIRLNEIVIDSLAHLLELFMRGLKQLSLSALTIPLNLA